MNDKTKQIQEDLREGAGKIWLAGIGALTMAGEESKKWFDALVEKGKEFEEREKPGVDAIKNSVDGAKESVGDWWSKVEGAFNERVAGAMEKMGVPTRNEIQDLSKRVDALMEAINKLNQTETKKDSKK